MSPWPSCFELQLRTEELHVALFTCTKTRRQLHSTFSCICATAKLHRLHRNATSIFSCLNTNENVKMAKSCSWQKSLATFFVCHEIYLNWIRARKKLLLYWYLSLALVNEVGRQWSRMSQMFHSRHCYKMAIRQRKIYAMRCCCINRILSLAKCGLSLSFCNVAKTQYVFQKRDDVECQDNYLFPMALMQNRGAGATAERTGLPEHSSHRDANNNSKILSSHLTFFSWKD